MFVGGAIGIVGQLAGGPWQWERQALVGLSFGLAVVEAYPRPNRLASVLALTWRQTSKRWRIRHGPIKAAFLWGADLGLGITTRVNFVSYWLLLAAGFACANPTSGMILMSGYGIGRVIELATGPMIDHATDRVTLGQALVRSEDSWHRLHACTLCAVGLLLLL